jgi:hypothetical protein
MVSAISRLSKLRPISGLSIAFWHRALPSPIQNNREDSMSRTAEFSLPVSALIGVLLGLSQLQAEDRVFDAGKPLEIADQGVFSIPGRYVQLKGQTIMVGQMYVQYQIPKHKTRPYPVVMIHGGGQTASNFLSTPDGR